jgi:predicted PurR-regulated permease PerM
VQNWANEQFGIEIDADALLAEFQSGGRAEEFAGSLASNILEIGGQVVGTLFRLLTIGLFTFYLVADGPRVRRTICSALPPHRQLEVLRAWEIAIIKTGGYIYSRGLLAAASAVVHWFAFTLLDIPSALPLALWVGVMSQLIPTIGTYLAGALPLAIAVLDDPVSALWVLAVIVVYQQIENYLLVPRVSAQTMDLHPAVAFGAVIAGAALLGATGALLALPAAATLQAFVSTYLARHEVVDSLLTEQRVRPPGLRERLGSHAHDDAPTPTDPDRT